MAAYAIGRLRMRDRSWLTAYGRKTAELVAKHGGRYLARGTALSGSSKPRVPKRGRARHPR